MKLDLTTRQQDVLTYIETYVAENGYAPSVRDIAAGLGLASPGNIQQHLKALEDKGRIERHGARAIKVI